MCSSCAENLFSNCSAVHKTYIRTETRQAIEIGDQQTEEDYRKVNCCPLEHKTHSTHDINSIAGWFRQPLHGDIDSPFKNSQTLSGGR